MAYLNSIACSVIVAVVVLLGTGRTEALADSAMSARDAPSSVVVDAARAACSRYAAYGRDYLQHEPGDGPLPPVPTGHEPFRASDADMLDLYNDFNIRGNGDVLGRYADDLDKKEGTVRRYSDEQCRVLVPAYALAKLILVLNVRPLDVSLHGLIDRCRDNGVIHLCFRRSLISIPARCGLPASAPRDVGWCGKPHARDPLASELERLRSHARDEPGRGSSVEHPDATGGF